MIFLSIHPVMDGVIDGVLIAIIHRLSTYTIDPWYWQKAT